MDFHTKTETWYKSIMQFARENYYFYGWDNFVECVDLSDFRRIAREQNWEFQSDAFSYFQSWCEMNNGY